MPFTFRLTFVGLCAFVPKGGRFIREENNDPLAQEAMVLLPNVLTPQPLGDHALGTHVPLLDFQVDHLLAESELRPSMTYSRPPGGSERGIALLQEADLEIWPEGREPDAESLELVGSDKTRIQHDTMGPRSTSASLSWILRAGDIFPGNTAVDKELLQPPPVKPNVGRELSKRVIARVFLKEGKLSAVVREPSGDFEKWRILRNNGSDVRKFIARRVTLEIRAQRKVDLVMKHHSSPDESKLSVAAPEDASAETVEVFVRNLELEDSLGLDILRPRPARDVTKDSDFAAYYSLTGATITSSTIIPVPEINESTRRGADAPTCRKIVFDPSS